MHRSIYKTFAVVGYKVIDCPTLLQLSNRLSCDMYAIVRPIVSFKAYFPIGRVSTMKIFVGGNLITSAHQFCNVDFTIKNTATEHNRVMFWAIHPQFFSNGADKAASCYVNLLQMHNFYCS